MNTERIYQGEDDLWYFNVRGNLAKGPFETYHDAEGALVHQVRQWQRPFGTAEWSKPLRSLKIRRLRSTQARHP